MTFSIHGLAVARGIAIGRAVLVASSRVDVAHYFIQPSQVEAEIARLRQARDAVVDGDLGAADAQFGAIHLALAAYNAGPGRPAAWVGFCGDPRNTETDPLDFIECIPFAETRNYVMRVMENVQVYRARLAGGSAPLTLTEDLRRGVYIPREPVPELTAALTPAEVSGGTSGMKVTAQP